VRVLLTGGSGTVGRELQRVFDGHDVVAPSHAELDVVDRAVVHAAVAAIVPDAIIHAAAVTNVDGCEDDPETAFAGNALATRHLREAAARVDAHLCYFSTDYVFDGARPDPYSEWDDPNPISVYGRSKLAGEREAGPDATIVRTAWVCGTSERNFVSTVLRLAAERDTLRFVDDQRSSPTMAVDLAPVVRGLVVDRRRGLFHVTNDGTASRYDMVRVILAAAGRDPGQVTPVPAREVVPPQRAPRPAQSALDNAVRRLEGAAPLPEWQDALARLVGRLV